MLYIKHINFNRLGVFATLVAITGACIGVLNSNQAYAATCVEGDPYSCISVTFGNLAGKTVATPSSISKSKIYFTMPVSITMNQVQNYSVTISDSNGGKLKTANGSEIPSVSGATSWSQFDDLVRAWGFRYTEGEYDDGTKDFNPIMTTTISEKTAPRGISTANYTLGFGVVVDAGTAAGEYSDTMTVSVVAQPRNITIFDIKYMQDMTPDICAATTTPNVNAAETDHDGAHENDPNYVPEVILRDTRGGGIDGSGRYLVRKLADGNCWMAQDLELDILGKDQEITGDKTSNAEGTEYFGTEVSEGLIFTANDTDLNSTSVWTPEYFKKAYVSTNVAPDAKVYATMLNASNVDNKEYQWKVNGSDGLRSYSFDASNTAWSYATITNPDKNTDESYVTSESSTGEPYDRRGNLYNFTAATLGSSLSVKTGARQAADSICPKGWQLPVVTESVAEPVPATNMKNKSFAKLLRAYGVIALDGRNDSTVAAAIAGANRSKEWPLQYPLMGFYSVDRGKIDLRNGYGGWWSGTITNVQTQAYYLNTWGDQIFAQRNSATGNGFAIRCVAR